MPLCHPRQKVQLNRNCLHQKQHLQAKSHGWEHETLPHLLHEAMLVEIHKWRQNQSLTSGYE